MNARDGLASKARAAPHRAARRQCAYIGLSVRLHRRLRMCRALPESNGRRTLAASEQRSGSFEEETSGVASRAAGHADDKIRDFDKFAI
ncbi:hypothetical protein GCM10025771_17970 [Niveibacterium umoris]